jgi:hypothetical protein
VVPPLTGVAVNVTVVPWHTGFADAPIETLTGRFELTVIVIVLDVAGLPVAHVAFDVSTQLITSLFAGVYVYVLMLVPTFPPLTFH